MNRITTLAFGFCFALALFAAARGQNGSNPTGGGGGSATCGSVALGVCYNNSGTFASDTNFTYQGGGVINGLEFNRPSGAGIQLDEFGGGRGVAFFGDGPSIVGGAWNQGAGQRVFTMLSGGWYGWAPSNDITASLDTALARDAAGVIQINSGTAAAYSELKLRSVVIGGSTPTLTGTCTTGSQTGGNTAGTFTATCVSQTVIITFAFTAPNGWICNAHDQSTPTDALNQTSSSPTSCTLTGTTVASDRISFNAVAY